jgi:GH15 family glucan-1,4-alpha-glucosidase
MTELRDAGRSGEPGAVATAWNEKRGAFTVAAGMDEFDSSVLLLAGIGLTEVGDPRLVRTVDAIEDVLLPGKHVMPCAGEDDFGVSEFLICPFWLIDGWWIDRLVRER